MSGASIRFRSLERSDYSLLAGWFSEPDVERWWNADASVEGIEAKYGPRIDGIDAATTMWIIEIGDHAGGLAQHYGHVDHPAHDAAVGIERAVGIDFLLSQGFSGRGRGPEVLMRFADLALELTPDACSCAATPTQDNRRSWRALEKAGFEQRGICQLPDEPPAFTNVRDRSR